MWVCSDRCEHLGDGAACEDALAGEWCVPVLLREDLELLIERELDSDVEDPEERGEEASVEGTRTLCAVDGQCSVEGMLVPHFARHLGLKNVR